MRPRSFLRTTTLALLVPACVVEKIDAIIAEHGVTYWPATESSTGDSSTTGTATGTSTSDGSMSGDSSTTTHGSMSGDSSTSGGASASLSAGEVSDSSTEPAGPICGDGLVEGDEECDDANAQDADACRNDCTRRWIVFVTSEPPALQGDLNGIIGADYQCRHRATKMFLPNGERYMAWISTSEVQPADRMHHARGPYVLVNGLQVAADWHALTSGRLEHPINITELGDLLEIAVWTGTDSTGLRIPNTQHCSDWTSNDFDQTGWFGDSTHTDALWTFGAANSCGGAGAIYCVEQP